MNRTTAAGLLALTALTGCNLVLGIEDLSRAPTSSSASSSSASSSSSTSSTSTGVGGGCDAPCLTANWAVPIGSPLDDSARAISVDENGFSVVAGELGDTANFGGNELTPGIFLAALTPDGMPVATGDWPISMPGTGPVLSAKGGLVYVAAKFTGDIVLDGATHTGPGAYIAQLDAMGHVNQVRVLKASAPATVDVYGLTATSTGVLVVGQFTGAVDFEGLQMATSTSTGADGFLAAYTTAPFFKPYTGGGASQTAVTAVAEATNGDLVITGRRVGATNFPTPLPSGMGFFVTRLTSDGGTCPAPPAVIDSGGFGRRILPTSDGGVVVVGSTQDKALTFPLVDGDKTVSSKTLFVTRLDSTNQFHFVTALIGAKDEVGVALSPAGNIVTVGTFNKTITFDGTGTLDSVADDAFFALLDGATGAWITGRRDGGALDDGAVAVGAAPGGAILTGVFNGTADVAGKPLSSNGVSDAFVARISGLDGF